MKIYSDKKGQALVEFALILPIILILIFGAIEFGRVFHAYHVITSAAREGARAGAVGKDDAEVESKIEGALSSLISDPNNITLITNNYDSSTPSENEACFTIVRNEAQENVEIKIKGGVKIILPIISAFMDDNPMVIESQAQMRTEYIATQTS